MRKARKSNAKDLAKDDFEQRIVDLARVTRVMAGGKRMRFRACVVVGDRRGRVGIAIAKGKDVTVAVNKAASKARRHLITVPIVNGTIPHPVQNKYSSAVILLKPAPLGRGVIAGGAARAVLELSGVPNIVSKMLGSRNKINNVYAVMYALESLRTHRSQ
ncbi:MAG: 30S ribosomal protein S5 [Candidatus Kerfeldbacteria bacterium]|nr:30S ribosomal protein S5 [Candidatus Kerfeldbacteria bacterium]